MNTSATYVTRELSLETLPDFEKLFETHPGPGAFSCWCLYNQRPGPLPESHKPGSYATRDARNRREKRDLVARGCSHGILVYAESEPVGWCQYGPAEELPRIENNPRYRKLAPAGNTSKVWRITCFTVGRKHRRRGVASAALHAALAAIREKGGGLVEAYPVTRRGANSEYRGSAAMFKREGFEIVARLGKDQVLVRRTV